MPQLPLRYSCREHRNCNIVVTIAVTDHNLKPQIHTSRIDNTCSYICTPSKTTNIKEFKSVCLYFCFPNIKKNGKGQKKSYFISQRLKSERSKMGQFQKSFENYLPKTFYVVGLVINSSKTVSLLLMHLKNKLFFAFDDAKKQRRL